MTLAMRGVGLPDLSCPYPPMWGDVNEPKRFSLTPMEPAKMFGFEMTDAGTAAAVAAAAAAAMGEHPKARSLGLCKVCGDEATGMYFGALVCVPCKTFFLRYAGDQFAFVCKKNRTCEITITSRTQCKYCRYQKCLSVGMCRKERPATVQLSEGQQLCVVCQDLANGVHFGAITCEGCKKFFRRGLTEHNAYTCKSDKKCVVNPRTRNACRFCRFQKCIESGMSREAIQMGRPSKIKYPSESGSGPKAKVAHLSSSSLPDSSLSSPTASSTGSFSPPAGQLTRGNFQALRIKEENDFDLLEIMEDPSGGANPVSSRRNGAGDGYRDSCPVTSTNELSPISPCSTVDNQHLRPVQLYPSSSHVMSHSPNSQTKCLDNSPYQSISSASTSPWPAYQTSPQTYDSPQGTPYTQDATVVGRTTGQYTSPDNSAYADYVKVKVEANSPLSTCSTSPLGQSSGYSPTGPSASSELPLHAFPQNSGAYNILHGAHGTSLNASQAALIQAAAAELAASVPSVSNKAGLLGTAFPHSAEVPLANTATAAAAAAAAAAPALDEDQSMQKHNAWSVYHVFQMAANGLFESKKEDVSARETTEDDNAKNTTEKTLEPNLPEDKDPLKLDVTERYWQNHKLPDENIIFLEDHWKNVEKILSAYDRFVQTGAEINIQLGNEFAKLAQSGQSLLPDYIEERVVRMYTLSSVKYCGEIPGFANFDLNDQYTIVRLGQSQSRILVAAVHWYDAEKGDFKDFLSWRAPTYEFKVALVNYCHKIHQLKLDKVEAALLNVLVLIATDYPELKNPEVIEEMRMNILKSFRAYTTALYGSPNKRIEELFSKVPELRKLGLHHHRMTFVTNLNGCG